MASRETGQGLLFPVEGFNVVPKFVTAYACSQLTDNYQIIPRFPWEGLCAFALRKDKAYPFKYGVSSS